MIIVDSSSLVAVAVREPDWMDHLSVIQASTSVTISPINYVEVGIVLRRHGFVEDQASLDSWLHTLDVKVCNDFALAEAALAAYFMYGKGFHPAALNLADAFAYALAKAADLPLLYKGDDFARTDVRSALQPT